MMKVAIAKVELLEGGDDLFAFAAAAAVDSSDDNVSGDDVGSAVGFDFIGANVEVFFLEEGLK